MEKQGTYELQENKKKNNAQKEKVFSSSGSSTYTVLIMEILNTN